MSEHNPQPPAWYCVGCGDDWPCPIRQRQLVAELGDGPWDSLFVEMTTSLLRAIPNLRTVPAGILWDRFVGWVGGAMDLHLSGETHTLSHVLGRDTLAWPDNRWDMRVVKAAVVEVGDPI